MTTDRRARVLALLARQDPGRPMPDRVCAAVVAAVPVNGAGLSLMGGPLGHRILVHGTDPASRQLEDLQFTLGVGPCVESVGRGGPVLVPDLAEQSISRWPGFAEAALGAGIRAIFAFPLQIGAVSLGALDLHRDTIGGLTDEELADILVFTDIATLALLHAPIDEPDAGGALTDWMADADTAVYQASGMVMAQLELSIDQAMLRLRGYAFLHDRPITEVAQEAVARRLRLP